MTEIADYERRISYALERIGRGVDGLIERQRNALEVAQAEIAAARAAAAEAEAAEAALAVAPSEPAAEPEPELATPEAAPELAAPEPVTSEPVTPEAAAEAAPEAAPAPAPVPAETRAEIATLREALDGERMANAQLSERVRAIREKQETTLSALERRLAQATRAFEAAQAEATRLKRANADLAETNRQLLEAAGDVPAHLVNRAMQAELEALRAARAWEVAELSDIITGLEPLVAAHAKESTDG